MIIRKLESEERIPAGYISACCFHVKVEEPETAEAKWTHETYDDWGAFGDDGTLMAHVANFEFLMNFDGQAIKAGGIGNVSTLPEYREEGCIREIFRKLLPDAYEKGEILSSLYPFSHSFYRKFGYETSFMWKDFTSTADNLRGYHYCGAVRQWKEGDDLAPCLDLYNRFAKNFNMAFIRDEKAMKEMIRGAWQKERYFVYVLGDEKAPEAYVAFQDVRNDPKAILRVNDYAFDGRRGLQALLGFLGRFSADYGSIEMRIPTLLNLKDLTEDPYRTTEKEASAFMVRVINAEAALRLLSRPAGTSFTIRVYGDEFIPENDRTFRVSDEGVTEVPRGEDIAMDIHALAPLITGASDLFEASLRSDVEIFGNEAVLRSVFTRKAGYLADHF